MREYAKVGPQFWTGPTGKALKKQGPEALIVAFYLMTCPHANMLGLYYLSRTYIAVDTCLGSEGASKGLAGACEAGFCRYDEGSEVVWVLEMAAYQIGDELDVKDNRCRGVQREYESVPANPFLRAFFERYARAFHMTTPRGEPPKKPSPSKGASKALRSQEQEQEHEEEQEQDQKQKQKPRKRGAAAQLVSVEAMVAEGVQEQHAADWLIVRAKKSLPLTRTAWDDTKSEAAKAGLSLPDAIHTAVRNGWAGFKAKWLEDSRHVAHGRGQMPDSEREAANARATAEAAAKLFGTQGEIIDAGA